MLGEKKQSIGDPRNMEQHIKNIEKKYWGFGNNSDQQIKTCLSEFFQDTKRKPPFLCGNVAMWLCGYVATYVAM